MVASAGPDEYRQAIEVALADHGHRRADRHLHAGGRQRSPRRPSPAIRDGIASARGARRDRQADPRLRDGRSGTAAAARRRRRAHPDLRVSGERGRARSAKVAAYADWRAQPPGLLWGFDDVHPEEARAICRGRGRGARRGLADRRGNAARARRVRSSARAERRRAHGRRGGGARRRAGISGRREAGCRIACSTRPRSAACA